MSNIQVIITSLAASAMWIFLFLILTINHTNIDKDLVDVAIERLSQLDD